MLVVVVGVVAIAISLVIGVVAFFTLGAAVLVLASVIGIRIWWLGLKARRPGRQKPVKDPATSAGSRERSVIEGEYRVIARDNKSKRPPD